MHLVILAAGAFVFLAHLLDLLFEKTRIPDVLLLMVLGVLVGPVAGWIELEDLGRVGEFLATVTLVVILTQSGMTLRLRNLIDAASRAAGFALVSMAGAVAAMAGLLMMVLDPWAAWLGAFILGGTSSAVVIPLLKNLEAADETSTVLTLESAITDVLCIIGTVGIATALSNGGAVSTGSLLATALFSLSVAGLIGFGAGVMWTIILSLTDRLRAAMLTTLAFALTLYGLAEQMGVSGAIAALAFGVTLGNLPRGMILRLRPSDGAPERTIELRRVGGTERQIYAEVVFLLKAFFFFYLGLTVRPSGFFSLLGLLALVLALIPLVPRWPAVRFILDRKHTSRRDALLSWTLVPRGLAAAVLAQIPLQKGIAGGEIIAETVAMTVFLSISAVAVLIALGERGLLNPVSRVLFGPFPLVAEPRPAAVAEAAVEDAEDAVAEAKAAEADAQEARRAARKAKRIAAESVLVAAAADAKAAEETESGAVAETAPEDTAEPGLPPVLRSPGSPPSEPVAEPAGDPQDDV